MIKTIGATLALCLSIAGNLNAQEQKANGELFLAKNSYINLAESDQQNDLIVEPPIMARPAGRHSYSEPIGKNIVTGSPINLVVVNNYGCYAVGVTYERLLGNQEVVGIQIPVHFAFGNNDWLSGNEGKMIFTTPGIQFHVAGAKRKFDYAIGPSVLIGNLYERRENYNNGYYQNYKETNTFTSGIMLDNNLNFQRKHFLFGIHATFGTTWWNANYPNQFFMQFGMRFGGRF